MYASDLLLENSLHLSAQEKGSSRRLHAGGSDDLSLGSSPDPEQPWRSPSSIPPEGSAVPMLAPNR